MPEPTVLDIPVEELQPDPQNIRRSLGDLTELVKSVASIGVVEPLLVTPLDDDGGYRIVAGHRRHAAAAEAGVASLPCLVRTVTEEEALSIQLAENIQRSALTVIEEAGGYLRMVQLGWGARRLAKHVGKSERHVRDRLALLELPDGAQEAVDRGDVTLTDAKTLLAVKDRPDIIETVLTDRPSDVERAVDDAMRRAEIDAQRAALAAELDDAGIRVVDDEGHRPQSYVALDDLGVDADEHTSEPCHAVVIRSGYRSVTSTPVCTVRRRHTKAGGSDVKVARTTQVDPDRERSRARRQAAKARLEFLSERLASRLPKTNAVSVVIATLIDRCTAVDAATAGRLLGLEPVAGSYGEDWRGPLVALAGGSEADALRAAVAVAAAMTEARASYGSGDPQMATYVGFLADLGYEPADEQADPATQADGHAA